MLKRIMLIVLLGLILLRIGYKYPVKYNVLKCQSVYTVEVYNILDVKLYDYVIEN